MKITIEWDGGFNEMTWNRVIENLNYDLRRLDYDSMLTVGRPSTECFHDSESHASIISGFHI